VISSSRDIYVFLVVTCTCLMCVASLDMMKVDTQENSTSTDQIMETVEVSEHHWWDRSNLTIIIQN